ncbi:MAG: glutamine--tRNA ligase/YqeY domain fusion protein [Candidatus Firestonebacteria bacterium]|nr:glutamine--tRNA ligase/YqeY domain fusion protein [Candidatus Firestonebacteria bacterium]
MSENKESLSINFIKNIIMNDLKNNKIKNVITRFPPEPNGYLHIGHAKSICINYGLAKEFDGICNLRFDDTNPTKENMEYINAIKEDVKWLGFNYENRLYFASNYFEQMYYYAIQLIKDGLAYVCDLSPDKIREYRGTLTEPGIESPYRKRCIEENLDLFQRMKNGEFEDGAKVLRAKINMSASNINLRDPVMYRILHAEHPHTGAKWCIYPTYDWAHGIEDSIEKITHSICTLEFEDHHPLYDWFLDKLNIHHPEQIEFARLNITFTILSKRKLLELVEENYVTGWDDPRMPTISGLRRRGYSPESIINFCNKIGVSKANSTVDIGLLEHCIREDLNKKSNRYMGVLRPLRIVIENYPDDKEEYLNAINNPEDPNSSTRIVPFSKVLYIEQDDFMENPHKDFYRLAPGREVRLRYAYFIKCISVLKDSNGNIVELRCIFDPDTKGGNALDGRKVKATIHWVSAKHAKKAEVRLYDRLFKIESPENEKDNWKSFMNTNSCIILKDCCIEPYITNLKHDERFQFERLGYFYADTKDHTNIKPVFNRIVQLKDPWEKIKKNIGKYL